MIHQVLAGAEGQANGRGDSREIHAQVEAAA